MGDTLKQIDIGNLTLGDLQNMSALTVVPENGEGYAGDVVNQDDANEAAVANKLDPETYNPSHHGGMSFEEYSRAILLGE